jgi:hypothetical protein
MIVRIAESSNSMFVRDRLAIHQSYTPRAARVALDSDAEAADHPPEESGSNAKFKTWFWSGRRDTI